MKLFLVILLVVFSVNSLLLFLRLRRDVMSDMSGNNRSGSASSDGLSLSDVLTNEQIKWLREVMELEGSLHSTVESSVGRDLGSADYQQVVKHLNSRNPVLSDSEIALVVDVLKRHNDFYQENFGMDDDRATSILYVLS